jgi:calcineurin-like phosphoesterase family protein
MSTFFTSDTHFGHANIIKYCDRPFRNYFEMDEALVTNWNTLIGPEDTVYHLGDFAFGRGIDQKYVSALAKLLNGHIHLINGNHEKFAHSIPWRFSTIKEYDEIEVEGQRIVLFHYGMRTWHHVSKGVWHLYGHSHNRLPAFGKSLDIGVDNWNYYPVGFAKLKYTMDSQPIKNGEI